MNLRNEFLLQFDSLEKYLTFLSNGDVFEINIFKKIKND